MKDEELIAMWRAQGVPDEEILKFLESRDGGLKKDIHGGAASFLQGASLGIAGVLSPDLKKASDEFSQEHSVLGPVTNVAGNVVGGLALPAVGAGRLLAKAPKLAQLAAQALAGGGAAAIQGATSGEDASEVARDAAFGAGAGVVLPWAAGKVARAVKRGAQPFRSAATQVAEGAGPLLPDDAAARMAAQEALAPGTATPVSVSPGMARSTRVIGANAPLAREAAEAAQGRVVKLQTAMNAVSSDYEALLAGKSAPLMVGQKGPNIQPLAMKYGVWPGGQGDVELSTIQKLRSALRLKKETVKGMPKAELGKDIKALSDWLEFHEPDVAKLDQKWGILSTAKRAEDKTIKHIAQSRESYASSRAAGIEPGSPGASLPTKANVLTRIFGPDRSRLAEEANRLLLQPGQIPSEMLKARARAAMPYQPNLWAPFVVGGQTEPALNLFD